MKKILMMLTIAFLFQGVALAEVYTVDASGSSVDWVGTKVTGAHDGSISISSGQIKFEDGQFVGGEAVIDMTSITVEDIKNPDTNQNLVDHLKNADFFDVTVHPEAMMKVTSVTPAGENVYDVTADFTIKDITNSVAFQARVTKTGDSIQASAEIKIDRTKYNVRYGSGKFFEDLGDRMIHDEFKLTVSIQASK